MEFFKDLFMLLGRICLGGAFLWGAYLKVKSWKSALEYAKAKHVPQAQLVLPAAIVLKVLGGLLVVFGWHAHVGAFFLLVVAVPSALWMHDFWKRQDEMERDRERACFMKDVAVIGGLLILLAMGAGDFGFGRGG